MRKSKKIVTDGDKFDKMKAKSSKKIFKTKKNKHKTILKNYNHDKTFDYIRTNDIDELENLN